LGVRPRPHPVLFRFKPGNVFLILDKANCLAYLPNSPRRFAGRGFAMPIFAREDFEIRAAVMRAMAHPTRLFIVDELSRGERCVCELTKMIGNDISTVSKHLSVLKKAGIIEDDKRGLQVFYRLRVPCVLNFFHCAESVIRARKL